MSDNVRPALYGADYSVRIANRVVGCRPGPGAHRGQALRDRATSSCTPTTCPADVTPGDLVAVPATGAYCWSLASNYNYLGRPAVVAVRDGAARVIVRRETEDDLLAETWECRT